MNTQISLEDTFHTLASNVKNPAVIISDRGLMDSKGYVGEQVFQKILDHKGWSEVELRDKRYDAVMHLVSAADGAEQFYDHENEARFETVEEAVIRERELRKAYVGHNKLFVIDNRDTFKKKMQVTTSTVLSVLGLPSQKTSFKKFLVDTKGFKVSKNMHKQLFKNSDAVPSNDAEEDEFQMATHFIEQVYLKAPDDSLIFVRKKETEWLPLMFGVPRAEFFDYECRYNMED